MYVHVTRARERHTYIYIYRERERCMRIHIRPQFSGRLPSEEPPPQERCQAWSLA